jgi:hypothetical protein
MQRFAKRIGTLPPWVLFAGILAIVVAVYWPVHAAGLVWDDRFYLHDRAWLRQGNRWMQIILHGFPDWGGVYFRPLGVALFTAEVRLFDTAPLAMHMTSLGLHLSNTLLVGTIARKWLAAWKPTANPAHFACLGMLLYGLHPAIIEPVAWISSQFDLLVTLFTLLGILANLALSNVLARSLVVAACFFLAACSKESAASFPLLLLVTDWLGPGTAAPPSPRFAVVLRRQWPVYLSMLAAGVAYLILRHAGVGPLIATNGHAATFSLSQLQQAGLAYLDYWKLLLWPMTGLNPIHPWPHWLSSGVGWQAFAVIFSAVCLAGLSAWLLYKRRPLGGLMSGFAAALLPVLHIAPIHFDDSIYHERYATTAIAYVCSLLPLVLAQTIKRHAPRTPIAACFLIAGTAWLLLAAVNIRATLPLWSNEVHLWRWALAQNPESVLAKNYLLSTYIEQGDITQAQPLADALLREGHSCPQCMLNVAFLALTQRDAQRAAYALQQAQPAAQAAQAQHALVMGYTLALGNLYELEQRLLDAEKAYRTAIAMEPSSPEAYMNLALLQARTGNADSAKQSLDIALSLSATDAERARRRREFAATIKATQATSPN